ncbi:hypothetical protein ACROYT_G012623 [Oculina patagonica]
MHQETEPITRQHIKNGRLTMRKTLRNKYLQNWLGTQNSSSSTSREKFTHKEVKKSYEFENYLTTVKNPAHRINLTKLRLGCHTLRIQTGKYENKGASIPVEQRTCLVDVRYISLSENERIKYLLRADNEHTSKVVGTAGDSLSYHRGSAFSTKDRDNDNSSSNCATRCKAGWWFGACLQSNLNGLYHHGQHSTSWEGVNWNKWKGASYSAKRAEMKIKPAKI